MENSIGQIEMKIIPVRIHFQKFVHGILLEVSYDELGHVSEPFLDTVRRVWNVVEFVDDVLQLVSIGLDADDFIAVDIDRLSYVPPTGAFWCGDVKHDILLKPHEWGLGLKEKLLQVIKITEETNLTTYPPKKYPSTHKGLVRLCEADSRGVKL